MKIRTQVLALVVGVVAPIAILATLVAIALWQEQRETFEQRFLERVSALRLALDAELQGTMRVLAAVSESADLDAPERLPAFRSRFSRLMRTYPFWSLVEVVDPAGTSIAREDRAGPPGTLGLDQRTRTEVVRSGAPVVSNAIAADGGLYLTYIAVPVLRGGQVNGIVYTGIEHAHWLEFLRSYPIAKDATLTLNDRDSVLIARTLNDERWVGNRSAPRFWDRTLGKSEGAFRNVGLEGQRFYSAFSRSRSSGWVLGTGVPQDEIEAALSSTTLAIVIGVVAASAVAFIFAWLLGGHIAESLTGLEATARSVAGPSPAIDARLPIKEAETVRLALHDSAERLRQREASLQESLDREAAARIDAEQANRAKDEFLAMLSHELRNPLSGITSAVALLGMPKAPTDAQRRAREVISRQTRHLVEMIDDLMDVARLNSGKVILHRKRIALAEAVRRVVDSFRDAGRCTHLEIAVDLQPVWVLADETRLEQIVSNLLDNACKYTPAHGRVVITTLTQHDAAVLKVRDTGIGIGPELAGRVFDVFAQGDRTLDRAQGGLGLGLAVVRKLVDLHAGTIQVASDGPGRGATFTVRFARAAGDMTSPAQAPAAAAPTGLRIAVVEDIADSREIMQALLTAQGHRVDVAADGPSGVKTILARHADVALVDLGLPGFDGHEVAQRVRAAPGGAAVLLIALTGYGAAADRIDATAAGFDAFLVKPFDLERFTAVLAAALDAKARGRPPDPAAAVDARVT